MRRNINQNQGGENALSNHVAVFWDLDNTYWTLCDYYGGNLGDKIEAIVDNLWKELSGDTVRVFRAYADFDSIHRKYRIQTAIQRKRVTPKHIFSSNANENRKNAGDIELSLDALETVFNIDEISHYYIISADKDMIPIINRLKYHGKHVFLVYVKAAIAGDGLVLNFADDHKDIESLIGLDIELANRAVPPEELLVDVPGAIKLVQDFYQRNKSNQKLFVGDSIFCDDFFQKTQKPRHYAKQLLQYCIEQKHLVKNGNKIEIPAAPVARS
jgi:uncharacterized LabA/DUF88 family protein